MKAAFEPLVQNGLHSVLLFGVPTLASKDTGASAADSPDSPVIQAIRLFKKEFPSVLIAVDLCICAYTDSGHCGILTEAGQINNLASITRLAEISLSFARAGCHLIAPSDMMDGRIKAIKDILMKNGLSGQVAVMSYSAKFASAFYGPFRYSLPAYYTQRKSTHNLFIRQ